MYFGPKERHKPTPIITKVMLRNVMNENENENKKTRLKEKK